MQISFSTGTFYHRGLGYSLKLAGETGYDGVELALGPEFSFNGIRGLQRAAREYPVPILSVHPPFVPVPGWPRQLSRSIPYLAQVTKALGVETCVVHISGFTSPQGPRAERFIRVLQEALRSNGHRLQIGLENSQYYRRKQRFYLDDLQALASFAGEHGCGVTFDTCHAGASGEDILACYEIVRPVLINVHLNDIIFRHGVPQTHVPPGKGQLPLDRFLGLLARDGYEGLVTLEIYPSRVGLLGRKRHQRELQEAIRFVRSAIAEPVTK